MTDDTDSEEVDYIYQQWRKKGDTLCACVNCGLVFITDVVALDPVAVRKTRQYARQAPNIFRGNRCICMAGPYEHTEYRLLVLK
ncbi:hypothetical protein [uncultured Mediterranean phage]|nr:hypothetical protein [uncultured Mediterranean phage]